MDQRACSLDTTVSLIARNQSYIPHPQVANMATKTRRPVGMVTPPPAKARSAYTAADKQTLLDNFDLEGEPQRLTTLHPLSLIVMVHSRRQDPKFSRLPLGPSQILPSPARDRAPEDPSGTPEHDARRARG